MCLANLGECHTVSLRLTSPVGPRTPDNRILGTFVRRALGNQQLQVLGQGTRKQNYIDVRDVAAAIELCISGRASGLYNIASAECISNYNLATACIEELSSHSRITFAETPDPEEGISWDVSIAKAQRELGYQPQFTIRDSIRAISYEYLHAEQRLKCD
jgi:nucleoside-diphosphate-sugar epimerase